MSDQGFGPPGQGGDPNFAQHPDFAGPPDYGQQPPPPQYSQQPPPFDPQQPPPQYGQQPPQYGQQPPPYGQQQPPFDPQQPPPQYGQQPPPQSGQQPPPYGPDPTQQMPPVGGQYGQQPQYDPGAYGQQPQYDPGAYGQQPQFAAAQPGGYAPGTGGGGGSHKVQWAVVAIAVLAALGVGAFFLFSGGSASASTPKDAVTKLFNAGKTTDIAAAKKVLCAADLKANLVNQLAAGGKVTAYTIGTVTQQDSSHATVTATVTTTRSPTALPQTIPVVKEGSTWKVCYPTSGIVPSNPVAGASTPVPSVSIPSVSIPSVSIPSVSIPVTIPSVAIPSLPGGLTNPCGFATTPSSAATIYVGLAELGESSNAQACVFQNSVPASLTASLHGSGTSLYAPENSGSSGPTFNFNSIDGKSKLQVTMTKESDGKYYVTKVVKS